MQKCETIILNFSKVWRKGSARAPDALRDLGRSPGGCNGPGCVRKDPVVEEIWYSIGRPDYHNRTAATLTIIEIRVFLTCAIAMPVSKFLAAG